MERHHHHQSQVSTQLFGAHDKSLDNIETVSQAPTFNNEHMASTFIDESRSFSISEGIPS